MGTSGDPWAPLGAYGDLWGPIGTFGDLWAPLGAHGGLWGPMGTFLFATFLAHTFSPFSHFAVQSLFYFCTAVFLIVQGGSPMIFQLCTPFCFFHSGGGGGLFRYRHSFSQFPLGIRPLVPPPIDKNIRHLLGQTAHTTSLIRHQTSDFIHIAGPGQHGPNAQSEGGPRLDAVGAPAILLQKRPPP